MLWRKLMEFLRPGLIRQQIEQDRPELEHERRLAKRRIDVMNELKAAARFDARDRYDDGDIHPAHDER